MMLLPFIDQANLYEELDFNVRVDQAPNDALISRPIRTYICPSAAQVRLQTSMFDSSVQVHPHNYPGAGTLHGWGGCGRHGSHTQNGVFSLRRGIQEESGGPADPRFRMSHITDGTSHTMAFSETAQGRETFVSGALNATYSGYRGRGWADPFYNSTLFSIGPRSTPNSGVSQYGGWNAANATSYHDGGVHVLFCDGAVSFISDNIDGNTWHRLGTPATGDLPGDF